MFIAGTKEETRGAHNVLNWGERRVRLRTTIFWYNKESVVIWFIKMSSGTSEQSNFYANLNVVSLRALARTHPQFRSAPKCTRSRTISIVFIIVRSFVCHKERDDDAIQGI